MSFALGAPSGWEYMVSEAREGEGKRTSHVLVYKDSSPILWVPSTSVGILTAGQ